MAEFVKAPNLPVRAKELLIGNKYSIILEKPLESLGISIIKVPDNPCVDKRLSGHADLSVFHMGGDKLLLAPYLKGSGFERGLESMGFKLSFADIAQCTEYPADAQLNACVVGRHLIIRPGVSCQEIVKYFTNNGRCEVISCRQGYARCSVCVVDESSIMTADRGIAAGAKAQGMNVLEISPGYIALDGFSYGFIGGAAFKLEKDILAFTGTLDQHPNKDDILRFLIARNIKPVYITNDPIFDIGGALPVMEK